MALALALTLALCPAGTAAADPLGDGLPPLSQQSGGCVPASDARVPDVPWAQRRLSPERVWPLTRGAGQVVAVIDSGVAQAPQLTGGRLDQVEIVGGRGGVDDCPGHGTFVAGLIAARPARDTGFSGVAPASTILPIRQTRDGRDGTADGLARAIRVATDRGADIINVSSASLFPDDTLRRAVEYATSKDVLIVAAVANERGNGNARPYPAAYPQVLAVGAIGPDGAAADFSGAGEFVDLVAPGSSIVSVGPRGGGHLTATGTSYAAPLVAGTAALVRAYHPRLTAAQVRQRLQVTADPPGSSVPDPRLGWGVVNPYAAVTSILPDGVGATPPTAPPVTVAAPTWPSGSVSGRRAALIVAVAATMLVVAVLVARAVVPRGRRRRWRPAGWTDR
ncbi:type VII secretion-associated serine protease mycosin [Micromonospora sp. WMMA1363]|uniref:type VII secretion-associated serine protease mycosin n=1 Tax=Micromonospora sp. WMMA1363 TaxID=3053985 RepID=UPI00338F6F77